MILFFCSAVGIILVPILGGLCLGLLLRCLDWWEEILGEDLKKTSEFHLRMKQWNNDLSLLSPMLELPDGVFYPEEVGHLISEKASFNREGGLRDGLPSIGKEGTVSPVGGPERQCL